MKHLSILGSAIALLWSIHSFGFEVEVGYCPANNLDLTLRAIKGAQHSILLNIYELSSPFIADALAERIQAGLEVQVIEEGQPTEGMNAASKAIQTRLAAAMHSANKADHFFVMGAQNRSARRFRFDHAKYAVIDGNSLLIGSENYTSTGTPKEGAKGNRGWQAYLHDVRISQEYTNIFTMDADTSHGDLVDIANPETLHLNFQSLVSNSENSTVAQSSAPPSLSALSVEQIVSPTTSLSGLLQLVNGAQSTLDIEQMTFASVWKDNNQSPLIDAVLAAAKRGVKVRILLNDENSFNRQKSTSSSSASGSADTASGTSKNLMTIKLLMDAATSQHLPLVAKTANLLAMKVDYIHNKGVVVDDKTLISSINWDENSIRNNREAAVLISGQEVHDYYEAIFEQDWNASN